MHAIFIRERNEPIVVDDLTGRALKRQWVEGIREEVVEFEGVSFSPRAILRIEDRWNPEVTREGDMDRNTTFYRDNRERYEEFVRELRGLPIEKRARNLDLARLIHYGMTGSHIIPSELARSIIERQEAYFAEHPDDAYAHPWCYRDLIALSDQEHRSVRPPMGHYLRENAFLLVERALQASYAVR